MNSTRLCELIDRVAAAVDEGPLTSVQIAVARHGQLLSHETLGQAIPGSRFCTYSCVKPLVSSLLWQLIDEGVIDVYQTVAHYFSEFGMNGKEAVTVEQLLCHTAGFPRAPMGPNHWWERSTRRERMSSWRLNWEPGSQFQYHTTSAHWVIAELIEILLQQDYRVALRQRVLDPLGLAEFTLGTVSSTNMPVNDIVSVGEPPTPEEVEEVFGVAMELPVLGQSELLHFNEPRVQDLGVPGAGGISTAADIAMFYQALLGYGPALWSKKMLSDATGNVRVRAIDPDQGIPSSRSIGLVVKGEDPHNTRRGMGRTCSGLSFGHNGVGGQVAWADPLSGISFCLLTNALDANPIRSARFTNAINNRAGVLHQPTTE